MLSKCSYFSKINPKFKKCSGESRNCSCLEKIVCNFKKVLTFNFCSCFSNNVLHFQEILHNFKKCSRFHFVPFLKRGKSFDLGPVRKYSSFSKFTTPASCASFQLLARSCARSEAVASFSIVAWAALFYFVVLSFACAAGWFIRQPRRK